MNIGSCQLLLRVCVCVCLPVAAKPVHGCWAGHVGFLVCVAPPLHSCIAPGFALPVLLADLAEKAGQYSQDVAVCGLALGLVAAGYYMISHRSQEQGQDSSSQHHAPPSLDAPHTPEEVLQQK